MRGRESRGERGGVEHSGGSRGTLGVKVWGWCRWGSFLKPPAAAISDIIGSTIPTIKFRFVFELPLTNRDTVHPQYRVLLDFTTNFRQEIERSVRLGWARDENRGKNDERVQAKKAAAERVVRQLVGMPEYDGQSWGYLISYEDDIASSDSWADLLAGSVTERTPRLY